MYSLVSLLELGRISKLYKDEIFFQCRSHLTLHKGTSRTQIAIASDTRLSKFAKISPNSSSNFSKRANSAIIKTTDCEGCSPDADRWVEADRCEERGGISYADMRLPVDGDEWGGGGALSGGLCSAPVDWFEHGHAREKTGCPSKKTLYWPVQSI